MIKSGSQSKRNAWFWVPSLYFAEGMPYVVAMTVSVIMYKRMGISNTDIALYTSWLYLPWVIKPLWSPVVDLLRTKRLWIITMQLVIGAGLAGVAFTIPVAGFFQYTLIFFWLLAFSSATHDIAADGFYMLGLSKNDQAWFVGIRSLFYRLAMITGQGLIVIFAGHMESSGSGGIPYAWMITFFILAGLFIVFFIYHYFVLPKPANDISFLDKNSKPTFGNFIIEFIGTFLIFLFKIGRVNTSGLSAKEIFVKIRNKISSITSWANFKIFLKQLLIILKNISIVLAFILLYRLGEAQLVKIAAPFLLDAKEAGGLALTTEQIGFVYGTVGVIGLTLGGILGGILCAKNGLKYWIWWMVIAINLPDLVYVYLAYSQTTNFLVINLFVAIEQFGYGFGFTAFMLYLIYISEGEHKTSHYAIATGFMALGMMIPGMFSGWLQEILGYKHFFIWVCIATIPGFIVTKFIPLDSEFGKKGG